MLDESERDWILIIHAHKRPVYLTNTVPNKPIPVTASSGTFTRALRLASVPSSSSSTGEPHTEHCSSPPPRSPPTGRSSTICNTGACCCQLLLMVTTRRCLHGWCCCKVLHRSLQVAVVITACSVYDWRSRGWIGVGIGVGEACCMHQQPSGQQARSSSRHHLVAVVLPAAVWARAAVLLDDIAAPAHFLQQWTGAHCGVLAIARARTGDRTGAHMLQHIQLRHAVYYVDVWLYTRFDMAQRQLIPGNANHIPAGGC